MDILLEVSKKILIENKDFKFATAKFITKSKDVK